MKTLLLQHQFVSWFIHSEEPKLRGGTDSTGGAGLHEHIHTLFKEHR